jgi:hypothetical protein
MKTMLSIPALAALVLLAGQEKDKDPDPRPFTDTFIVDVKDLAPTGRNPYLVLEPGYQLVLENPAKKEVLAITVLDEIKKIGGVETRVVEEREMVDGKEKEVSRNFLAICRKTGSVYYFGEDAGGAWIHGEKGARYGMLMPGTVLVGARHYQEIAPGAAMDRAEVISLSETIETPAGKFEKVLKVLETSPLEPDDKSHKFYAPGVGLVREGGMKLVRYGKAAK